MSFIELKNIKKSYLDGKSYKVVLENINLQVDKGDFIAIKGASGVGKTTLLSILGTLLQPDSGNYFLDGKDIYPNTADYSKIRNNQIGFVFQNHKLLPQLNAIENILLPTLAYKSKCSDIEYSYAHELMNITGIESVAKQYPSTLSGGEASRVVVCRALIMKPLLLLADEPTGQLDSKNAHNIAKLLADINKSLHTTILMVTHSDSTSQIANNILTLNDGILQ